MRKPHWILDNLSAFKKYFTKTYPVHFILAFYPYNYNLRWQKTSYAF